MNKQRRCLKQLECLKRETSGTDFDCNNRNCDECSLCYEQGNMGEQKEALDMAIKALEQQPCGDTISRQTAIDAAIEATKKWDGLYPQGLNCEIQEAVNALPSAQPEQRRIPVAERMPEDEGPYLVYGDFPDNGYLIAYAKRILNWKKTNFFIAPFWNSPSEVIHAQAWCKLPSPYRAERSKQ